VAQSEFLALKQTLEAPIRPPSVKRSDYPAELEEIVVRGLARERNARWSTARELQVALEAFARKEQLALSGVTLARLMEELFPNDLHAWQEAQSRGASLSQHLEESHTLSLHAAAQLSALSPGLVLSEQRTQSLVRAIPADDEDDEDSSDAGARSESFAPLDSSLEVALAKRKRQRSRVTLATTLGTLAIVATSAIAVVAGGHKAAPAIAHAKTAATSAKAAATTSAPATGGDELAQAPAGRATPTTPAAIAHGGATSASPLPSPSQTTDHAPAHPAAISGRTDDATPRRPLVRASVTPARTRHVAAKKPPARAQASGWDPEAPLLPH
jgi:hypothetical protein